MRFNIKDIKKIKIRNPLGGDLLMPWNLPKKMWIMYPFFILTFLLTLAFLFISFGFSCVRHILSFRKHDEE